DGKVEPIRALNWADASSGGYTSQWYGHNPNTPQGRSSPVQAIVVDNLGYGTPGAYQPDVKSFLLVANIYHNDHSAGCTADPTKRTTNGTCGGKNALGLVLVPVAADPSNGNPGTPDDPNPIDPTGGGPGTTLGGCSTGGGSGAGAGALLLGLAAMLIRR